MPKRDFSHLTLHVYLLSIFIKILTNTSLNSKVAFSVGNWYNFMRNAEVAQQVEQRTENPRVPSPILGLGTIFERK